MPPNERIALLPGTRLCDPTYARVLAELAAALRRRGWQVRVFCPQTSTPRSLEQYRPAVINLHFSGHLCRRSLLWARNAQRAGAVLALTFQDIDHPDLPRLTAAKHADVSRLVASAEAVVALTVPMARQVRRRHNRRGRIEVIGNGVGPRWFVSATRRGGPIVCVARLAPYKGIDILLWSFADLARCDRSVRLAIFGPDFQRGHYRRLARALGVAGRVRFAGLVGEAELRRALRRAPLVISASRRETYGMALLEAMATGAPVLATRTGVAPDLLRQTATGWRVRPGDPAALTRALRRLWSDPALRARLGTAARQVAARHLWTERAARYDALFRGLLRARRSGR